ncbi:PaaI family thioesterase [Alcanivorax sp. JB21]|uniref:PaaI family thioesterase n=1 Tax=Alcanivorax limicola TaxID=2874102 RepID=UPI001CBEBA0F|nr:PaaI family thioesterase [Alcanivorax limicola]MBZ2187557.1 PaaI family thioesterase [Alcanivorax limicola]
MPWTTEDEIAWTLTNPFRQFLGVEVAFVDGPVAEITLPVHERLLQAYGMVHGGIYCVLIDTVLGTAVRGASGADSRPLTVDLNVSFLRPAGRGRLRARASIIKHGRQVTVGNADVFDDQDRKVATGRGSFLLGKPSPDESG